MNSRGDFLSFKGRSDLAEQKVSWSQHNGPPDGVQVLSREPGHRSVFIIISACPPPFPLSGPPQGSFFSCTHPASLPPSLPPSSSAVPSTQPTLPPPPQSSHRESVTTVIPGNFWYNLTIYEINNLSSAWNSICSARGIPNSLGLTWRPEAKKIWILNWNYNLFLIFETPPLFLEII